jgi:hypothetical protein
LTISDFLHVIAPSLGPNASITPRAGISVAYLTMYEKIPNASIAAVKPLPREILELAKVAASVLDV